MRARKELILTPTDLKTVNPCCLAFKENSERFHSESVIRSGDTQEQGSHHGSGESKSHSK